jgi:hypothetical protein
MLISNNIGLLVLHEITKIIIIIIIKTGIKKANPSENMQCFGPNHKWDARSSREINSGTK